MILYDFQCEECNQTSEHGFDISDCPQDTPCPSCGGRAVKIISIPGAHLASESPEWIKSIRDVVEKNSGKPHCQEFLKDPTRDNYKKWMKGEGVRHMEAGEKPGRPAPPPSERVVTEKLLAFRQQKRALGLR